MHATQHLQLHTCAKIAYKAAMQAPALYPEVRGAKAELQEMTQRQAQGIWRQQDSPYCLHLCSTHLGHSTDQDKRAVPPQCCKLD